jgi:hypothetical protein
MLKMKILSLLLIAAAVSGQDWEDTVTEGLLQAQADLSLGHEFFEMNIIGSRDTLSVFINSDVSRLLDSHMDAYAEMRIIADDTTAALDEIAQTPETEQCIAAVINRWRIQISRAGQGLSRCIATPTRSKTFFFLSLTTTD